VFVEPGPPPPAWPIVALIAVVLAGIGVVVWLRRVNSYLFVAELKEKLSAEDTAGE
jgi:hypothetical protein